MSRIWCPESIPKILHARINKYDLLVLANEDVGRAIYFGGCYEPAETNYLRNVIGSDAVCVDVGANVGYFTMLMAEAAKDGSVHAFEPILLNVALLRSSMALNGFANIRINQCAVGDSVGVVSFSQSTDGAYSSIHDTQRKPLERNLKVPVTTLDNYLERESVKRVDILKVDVEGAEGLVVAGAFRLLNDERRRPRVIMMELYDPHLHAFGSSVKTLTGEMEAFGYKPFIVNDEGQLVPFSDELKARYYNFFFIPSTAYGNQ